MARKPPNPSPSASCRPFESAVPPATASAAPKMRHGSAKVRLDDKGRLAVPNRFRDALQGGDGLVLTMHPHGCLLLYTGEQFAQVEGQFRGRPNLPYFDSHLEEVVVGCAESVQLDSANRFLINGHLRELAVIERDVLLFGVGRGVRLWDEKRWEKNHLLMMSRLQDEEFSETWRNLTL